MKELDIDPRAKGLIFDLDGTLADTMPAHYLAWKSACKSFGIDYPIDLFLKLAGVTLIDTAKIINQIYGTNIDPAVLGEAKENAFIKTIPITKPIEPVAALVKKYYGILPMAIGTGGSHDIAWETLKTIGLKKYFKILIGAEDITKCKPDPETFLKGAALMNVEPEFCQVFEDGKLGLQAARDGLMIATDVTPYYVSRVGCEVL